MTSVSHARRRAITGAVAIPGIELADFQREAIEARLAGESGLIHSATGSGKTLAAWLGPLQLDREAARTAGLRVLWITPLRALANDTRAHLESAADALGMRRPRGSSNQ